MKQVKPLITAALVLGVAPTAAANPVSLGGPELLFVPFFLAAPVAIVLFIAAFKKRGTAIGTFCISLLILYTGLFGISHIVVLPRRTDVAVVLVSLAFLCLLAIGLVFYFATTRRRRLQWMGSALTVCIGLAFISPSIASYRYYTMIDNDPIDNPNDAITSVLSGIVQLSDGRLLQIEERYFNAVLPVEASVIPLQTDRFQIFVRSPTPGYVGSERERYQRDTGAIFQFSVIEIARNAYVAQDLGVAHWVGVQRERNLKLFAAADNKACQTDAVAALLAAGANPNISFGDQKYYNPLFRSIVYGCIDNVGALVETGADLSTVDNDNNTPLHWAARRSVWNYGADRTVPIIQLLVNAGADLSAKNSKGQTPLHHAATNSAAHTSFLIAAGADINAVNEDGQTPLELARHYFGQGYGGGPMAAKQIIAALEAAQGR